MAEGVGNAPAFASVSVGDVAVLWLSTAWAGYVHPSFGWQADPILYWRVMSDELRFPTPGFFSLHSSLLI